MNIGEWLLQIRRSRKLDLRAMADLTGLDIGTISKIENGRTQATLGTIVRTAIGLGLTLNDFLQDWQGKPFLFDKVQIREKETVPMLEDVEALVTSTRTEKQLVCVWLAHSLNKIAALQGDRIPLFEPEVIEKLLFGPLWHRYEVQYPTEMSTEEILAVLRQNGVMVLSDIKAFLKSISRKKQTPSGRSDAFLKIPVKEGNRLEISSVERTKMIDVLLLDQELQQGGKMVAMYWNVCLFNEELLRWQVSSRDHSVSQETHSAEQEARLAFLFLAVCRWLQHLSKADHSWLGDFRQLVRPETTLP